MSAPFSAFQKRGTISARSFFARARQASAPGRLSVSATSASASSASTSSICSKLVTPPALCSGCGAQSMKIQSR